MRPTGQPPVDRISRVFLLSLSRRGGDVMTASARQHTRSFEREVPRWPKPVADSQSRDHEPATVAVASSPVLPRRAKLGRRPQRLSNQSRLSRVVWKFPRRSALANYRLPLALPQSSGRVRNPHVSLNPLSVTLSRRTTQKTPAFVQKLWTKRLRCGRHRKSGMKFPLPSTFSITCVRSRGRISSGQSAVPRPTARIAEARDHRIRGPTTPSTVFG
jgi:hypothetical protein